MKKIFLVIFILGLLCIDVRAENGKMIDTFNHGQENELSGLFNRGFKEPSKANVYLDKDIFYGKNGRSLKIEASKKNEGWCFVWMHLFNTKDLLMKKKVKYFNTQKAGYKYVSFMIRGEKGNEDFMIGFADETRVEQEDPFLIGSVKDYIKNITKKWQEVIIPLEDIQVDISKLGLIIFDFKTTGSTVVYVDNICFKKDKSDKCSISKEKYIKKTKKEKIFNAMWVWDSKSILLDKKKQDELFRFCKKNKINELFFQTLYAFKGKKKNFKCDLLYIDELKVFIRNSSKNNIKIHALDGYPDWVMRERHHEPMALCDAICEYNKGVSKEEKFYGIHLDNEPYLMIGFKSPFRNKIYKEYIELNDKLQSLVDKSSGMVFGIDIPFFLEEADEKTGEIAKIKYKGKTKPVSYHLLDIVDNVGIMAYRDFAYGADGVILHSEDEIKYADKVNKNVYIGLELFKYPLIKVLFPAGLKKKAFYKALKTKAKDMAFISRIDGFRIQVFESKKYVHIGVEIPEGYKDMKKVEESINKLARAFSINEYKKVSSKIDLSLEDAEFGIPEDVEWQDFESMEWGFDKNKEKYRGFKATLLMLPKITFAEEKIKDFNKELECIKYEFGDNKSFYGFAFHYYGVYKGKK